MKWAINHSPSEIFTSQTIISICKLCVYLRSLLDGYCNSQVITKWGQDNSIFLEICYMGYKKIIARIIALQWLDS